MFKWIKKFVTNFKRLIFALTPTLVVEDEVRNSSLLKIADNRLEDASCYFLNKYPERPEVVDSLAKDPPSEKSIIFIETSCNMEDGLFSLDPRQACAVESAARHNSEYQVHVLYLGPRNVSNSTLHNILKHFYQVKFHEIDLMSYVDNTPVMDLVKNKLRFSKYAMTHLSDVLRLLTLWKYGGVYMDLDVVVVKPLWDLPSCFVGAEDSEYLGNSVMAFNRSVFGRAFVDILLRELVWKYDGSAWGANGPGLITRVIKRICPHNGSWPTDCKGLRLLEHEYLYPIPLKKWNWYIDEQASLGAGTRFIIRLRKDTRVHVYHLWNTITHGIRAHAFSLYASLAEVNCPKVYSLTYNKF